MTLKYWAWVLAVNWSASLSHDLWHRHIWYCYVASLAAWFVFMWALERFATLRNETVKP